MVESNSKKPCAVILTAIPVEYNAIRSHLRDPREEIYRGTIYERGIFTGGKSSWEVGIAQIGAGNSASAAAVERAITHFAPDIILFVGVAGGVKDVKIGDVVAVTKAYGYESGKVHDAGFFARPEVGMSSYRLVERAKAEARKKAWLQRIPGYPHLLASEPLAFVGPIAAGEKVIASTKSKLFVFLHSHYNDTLAVEMEGRGFLEAAHTNDPVQALIIRGISDLLANKSTYDAQGSQEIAARHAAAFAFEILAQLDDERKKEEETTVRQKRPGGSSKVFHTTNKGNVGISTAGDQTTVNAYYGPIYFQGSDDTQFRQQHEEPEASYGQPKQATTSMPVEIYFSYAREEENLVKQFQNQLASLQRLGLITYWNPSKVVPGQVVDAEITRHLNAAHIILLFISPDYMASDACNQEMNRAVARKDAVVIPILLRPLAGLEDSPFSHLQSFPRDGRSIAEWGSRKGTAFAEIANEISAVVKNLKSSA